MATVSTSKQVTTTDATPTTLADLGPLNRLAIAEISAHYEDPDVGDSSDSPGFWVLAGQSFSTCGAAKVENTIVSEGSYNHASFAATWNESAGNLILEVTGIAGVTVEWRCTIRHWETA